MKNYREAIEKYRHRQMTEEEKKAFEEEMQQAAALFDYLMEEDLAHELTTEYKIAEETTEHNHSFVKEEQQLKKKIRRRLLRWFTIAAAILFLIGGLAFWGVPQYIDATSYNPLEGESTTSDGNYYNNRVPGKFEQYQKIRSQIDLHQDQVIYTSGKKVEAGKYEINLTSINPFRGMHYYEDYSFDKGEVEMTGNYNMSATNLIYGSSYREDILVYGEGSWTESFTEMSENIAGLPNSAMINLKLTFPEAKSWEELQQFISQHPEVTFFSAGVDMSYMKVGDGEYYNHGASFGIRFDQKNQIFPDALLAKEWNEEYRELIKLYAITPETDVERINQFLMSTSNFLLDHKEDNYQYIQEKNYTPAETDSSDFAGASFQEQLDSENKLLEQLVEEAAQDNLTYNTIEVAVSKNDFPNFVTQDNFYYMQLKDLSIFSIPSMLIY